MIDTTPAALRTAAASHGAARAYVEGDRVLSFAELLAEVESTAAGYAAHGVNPGDRVCLWAPNSIDWVIAALAVHYAGATLVPINSRYTGHEAADIVARTRATLAVVADGFLGRSQIKELTEAADLPDLREIIDIRALPAIQRTDPTALIGARARADGVGADTVADILFTSGTTGRPKGVLSAHRQTVGVARAWGELGGVTATDRYLVINPFFHSFGYKAGIVVGLLTGATFYPMTTFDLDEMMRIIEEARITLLPGAPTIFTSLLNAPGRAGRDLSSLRVAVTGAAIVPVVLVEQMRAPAPQGLGIDHVITAFGMTEAVVATMCRRGDPDELVANTCGRAIPGVEVRIAKVGTNDPLPAGDEGELLVRGDIVMLGYLDDPGATAEAIDADGWLHTGDVGTLDEGGNLKITDRLKDMYISGGFNVYPAEVEQVLMRLDGVADVAAVGVPDERMGEVGKAFVVRADSPTGEALTADDVIAFARAHLANFKVPRQVEFTGPLPRNLSGKVLKKDLR